METRGDCEIAQKVTLKDSLKPSRFEIRQNQLHSFNDALKLSFIFFNLSFKIDRASNSLMTVIIAGLFFYRFSLF